MTAPATSSRKRAVNLTLSQAVVNEAKHYSDNLSATVEELLAGYVVSQREAHDARLNHAKASISDWNALHDSTGSFADEHSPL